MSLADCYTVASQIFNHPPNNSGFPVTHTLFSSVGLPPAQIDNLASLGYLHMTPIQALSLPAALAGKDLIAQAKTGSGKTAAFALPLLTKLNPRDFGTQD